MSAIIRFFGYNPLSAANTLAGQLILQRTSLGLSQRESAGLTRSGRPGCRRKRIIHRQFDTAPTAVHFRLADDSGQKCLPLPAFDIVAIKTSRQHLQ